MIGTLDSQVIEKFREFQDKTGKYLDLDIENVEFENKYLKELVKTPIKGGGTPDTKIKKYWLDDFSLIDNINYFGWRNIEKDLFNNKFLNKYSKVITKEAYDKYSTWLIPSNSILIAIASASKGLITINNRPMCTNQNILGVVINDYNYTEYIYYCLKNLYSTLIGKKEFGNLTKGSEEDREILIPKDYNENYKSMDIQKAIVEFLEYSFDTLDRIKSNIDKRYDIVTKMKKSLIPSTFKRTAIKNKFQKYAQENNIDFNITDIEFDIKRIYSKNGNDTVCKKRMGFTPEKTIDGDINWFNVEDLGSVEDLYIHQPNTKEKTTMNLIKKKIDPKSTGKSEKLIPIHQGDILVSFKLTVGVVKIYNSDLPAYCNEAIDILTVDENYDNKYIAYNCMLEYPKYGTKTNNGITLNDDDKTKIKVFIPKNLQNYTSFEIQQILANFIEYISSEIDEKYTNKMKQCLDIVSIYKETYLKRTFNKIVWS